MIVSNVNINQKNLKLLLNASYIVISNARNVATTSPRLREGTVELARQLYAGGKEANLLQGERSPVCVIHGLFGQKQNWNYLSKQISMQTNREVIALDVRNHGDSPWSKEMTYKLMSDDLLDLLDRLKVKHCNLIGHSLGGRIAMLTALREPSYVSRLVVVDMNLEQSLVDPEIYLQYIKIMQDVRFTKEMNLSTARRHADEALQAAIQAEPLRQFLVSNIHHKDEKLQWKLNLKGLENNIPNITEIEYPSVTFSRPTIFVLGGRSDYKLYFDDRENVRLVKKRFPNAKFEVIPNAGHWLHSERPRDFLNIVCKFLQAKRIVHKK